MPKAEDLTGRKFNHLEVIKPGDDYISPKGNRSKRWWCLCDCQRELPVEEQKLKLIPGHRLRSGVSKSCGCNKYRKNPHFIDWTNHKFGRFTVIKQVPKPKNIKNKGTYWECQCECGKKRIMISADIKRQNALSCGECSTNTFDITGNYGIGYTSNDERYFFDLEDYEIIKQYSWSITQAGYLIAWDKNRQDFIYMHRLVMGVLDKEDYVVDHRYHNTLDNQKEHLRICTHQENIMNSKLSKNNTSGITGVSYDSATDKWVASIMLNYKNIYLGVFKKFDDAVNARKEGEEKYFGEYKYINSTGKQGGRKMNEMMALLLADGYKHTHAEQFPKGLTKLVSYVTPRKSRLKTQDYMILFGLQAFLKNYLIDYFNENFFQISEDEVIKEYQRVINNMLGAGNYDTVKIRKLHQLGYLPLQFSALPEGTKVPMHVPCIEVTNTHKDFAWVVQWVESLLSSEIWKPCIHANVGYSYRQIVNYFYDLSVDKDVLRDKAISDFGFRGMSCLQEAMKASAAWLLSFSGTATIPAIPYLERTYNCDNTKKHFATNAISTEHSVMASNFAVDGDEVTFIKRLLTEIYPNASFSMVSDTYDLFNLIDNVLPECKEEIMNHNGKLLIRPDSGDIVEVSVKTVEHLYELFPGKTNNKGFKTLDSHIGVVYGDGVTQQRAKTIYSELIQKGFAANCIVFGAGSFSFNAIEENGQLSPYTRDSFSVAIKATYGEVNGEPIFIFKNPKTDTDHFKKSQKGLCFVFQDELTEEISYRDEYDSETITYTNQEKQLLQPIFRDGKMLKEFTLQEIRDRLHADNGGF